MILRTGNIPQQFSLCHAVKDVHTMSSEKQYEVFFAHTGNFAQYRIDTLFCV